MKIYKNEQGQIVLDGENTTTITIYKEIHDINDIAEVEEGLEILMTGFCIESKDDPIYKMSQELKEYYSK